MSNALRSLLHRDAAVMPVLGRYGHCAVCRSGYLRYELEGHWYNLVLWCCDHCGARQRYPLPERVERREQYDLRSPLRDAAADWNFIARHTPVVKGRLLQVDCEEGGLLVEAQKAGWDVAGLDRSEFMARRTSKETGIPVAAGTLETCEYEDSSFDGIVLWNLLELAENPQRYLEAAARKLKPGGRVFLQTPNADSFLKTLGGRFWPQLAPVHRFIFNVPSLREVCHAAGLRPIEILTPGLRVFSRAFLQRTGWLLFLMRSVIPAKIYDRLEAKWQLSLVTPDPLRAGSRDFVGRWMEWRKRGDQILMVAQKIAEPSVECPVCRSTLVEEADESLKCLRCDTRRLSLPAASLAQPDGGRVRFLKAQQSAWMSFLDAAERRQYHGRLLDLGCADGTFMQMARQRGWDVWGVEPGDYEATVASPMISMRMITAGSWSERFMPESCQMITLWDTLHQVVEPAETLKTAHRLLAPDGHLMIRMISPKRSQATKASMFQRRFFGLGSACWLYEIEQLKTLLAHAGFTDIQIDEGVRLSGTGDDAVYIPRSLQGSRPSFFADASPWIFVMARRPAVPPARRQRVLHLVESMEDAEVSDVILGGIEALPFNRYQSDLMVGKIRSTPRVTALRKQGVRVRPQDLFHPWSQPLNIWHAYQALVPLIEEGSYDIVHAYGWKAGVIGRLAGARARRRSKRRLVKKIIYQPMGHRFYGFYGRRTSRLVSAVERFLGRWSDALIVPTERGAFEFVARHAGQFDKTAVIPQGALLAMNLQEAAAARAAMGVLEDGWFIGYWGALEQRNGLEDLLQAAQSIFSERVDARIVVVGKGAARTYFHDMAKQLSISDRVHFLEDHMDLELFLSTVDLVVVPDPTDGVPRILLQSAAAGKPVLTTQVGGHSSIVIDGVTGRLVPPHDPGAIAKMALTIGQDSKEMSRFGAAARTWVQKLEDGNPQFSEQRMASLMRSFYEELG